MPRIFWIYKADARNFMAPRATAKPEPLIVNHLSKEVSQYVFGLLRFQPGPELGNNLGRSQ